MSREEELLRTYYQTQRAIAVTQNCLQTQQEYLCYLQTKLTKTKQALDLCEQDAQALEAMHQA